MEKSKVFVNVSEPGVGIGKVILSEHQADLNRRPKIMAQPGHWNYLLTKSELAFIQSTDMKLEEVDKLYWYNDRFQFFNNWRLNYMLLRISDSITAEDIHNMDIPIPISAKEKIWRFNITDIKEGDYIIGIDKDDDVAIYIVH